MERPRRAGEDDLHAYCSREYPRLVGSLALYTGDTHLAEDLAQETLARVVRDWPRVGQMERPGAYAHRIAMNLAKSHFRRRTVGRRVGLLVSGGAQAQHHDPPVADQVAVRSAILDLPPRRRQIVALRFVAELTMAEIADTLGIAEGTVKSELHHALAALRTFFREPVERGDRVVRS